MKWSARVRAVGRGRVAVYVRDHRFEVGRAVEFDAEAPTVSALEHALAALAADLVDTFSALARRRRVELDAVEAVVTGELNNPLTVLEVVGEEGHPGLERIALKLYVQSGAAPEALHALWRDARALSPLARTLGAAVDLRLALEVLP